MGARFAPFSFGGLLLQSYRPHLTQANRTHRTGIPSTSNLVDSMNTLFVNNEKMKLRYVQMMVRLIAEKRLGEENRKAGKNSWGVHSRHKESPRKHSVFKGLWLINLILIPMQPGSSPVCCNRLHLTRRGCRGLHLFYGGCIVAPSIHQQVTLRCTMKKCSLLLNWS